MLDCDTKDHKSRILTLFSVRVQVRMGLALTQDPEVPIASLLPEDLGLVH
jgi:hypothetical protein